VNSLGTLGLLLAPLSWVLSGDRLELAQTLAPGFVVSDHRLVDLEFQGAEGSAAAPSAAKELVVLGASGEVRVFASRADGSPGKGPLHALEEGPPGRIPDPARSLVDLMRMEGRQGLDLVVVGPRDTRVYPRGAQGFSAEGVVLARRASHGLRVGAPRFVDVAQDVNGDGRADLVVPATDSLKLWLAGPPRVEPQGGTAWPNFALVASLSVDVSQSAQTDGEKLSDVLSASFSIPALSARDVNGDGRPDLTVSQGDVRAFHLQAADATFPQTPTVQVDLSIFRDTIEKAELRPGHTLAASDDATYETRDLDLDGIPDYVIAHRRKVWVFHGGPDGPQFSKPSSIFKTADDITALQLLRLDGDEFPDLLLIKVQVPTIAALVRGIFGEWDVEVAAAGYLSQGGRAFEDKPSKRGELAVRLPAILRLVRNPESFLKRFEDVGARFRRSVWGDFDGSGVRDVVLASEDGSRLELWLSGSDAQKGGRELDGEALLSQLLFEDPQRVWDLDRIAGWLGGIAERRTAILTGGKPSVAQFPIRPWDEARIEKLEAADLDGDGRDEIVLAYTLLSGGERVFDVLRLVR